MHTVEVFRPEHGEPRILIQRRPDEETFAATVQEAHKLMDEELNNTPLAACERNGGCLGCALYDALEGLR